MYHPSLAINQNVKFMRMNYKESLKDLNVDTGDQKADTGLKGYQNENISRFSGVFACHTSSKGIRLSGGNTQYRHKNTKPFLASNT